MLQAEVDMLQRQINAAWTPATNTQRDELQVRIEELHAWRRIVHKQHRREIEGMQATSNPLQLDTGATLPSQAKRKRRATPSIQRAAETTTSTPTGTPRTRRSKATAVDQARQLRSASLSRT